MILTVTLNPALDKLLSADDLIPGEANRVETLSYLPAGKGIDVAKVLRDLKEEVVATGFLGGTVASIFHDCFRREGITDEFLPIAGTTRTNLQIFDKKGKRTELLERGPEIAPEEWKALLARLDALLPRCRAVTVCGSAPGGVTPAMFGGLIRRVKESGALTVVDASGALLRAALPEKPHLIKPNRTEMLELMGRDTADLGEILSFARELVADGIRYVLCSLGRDGAVLAGAGGVWRAAAPDVPVKSTLGCGDTMVASMALSLAKGLEPAEMLRNATALSSANAMTFETAHIAVEDYEALLPRCPVEKIV